MPPPRRERQDNSMTSPLPLTLGQLDFWEEFQAHPDHPVSTVAHLTEFRGALDPEALARAITIMASEADVLSLRFQPGPPPLQRVDPAACPPLVRLDLRDHPSPDAEARRLMQADIDRKLDLATDALSALWLVRTGQDCWLWYLRGHHIFLDGFAMSLIERRVARLYGHLTRGDDAGRPFDRLADYIAEETAYRDGAPHQAARAHWRAHLGAGPRPAILRKGSENYPATPRSADIPLSHLAEPLRQASARLELGWPDILIMLCALWLWHRPEDADHRPGTDRLVWLPLMGRMGSVSANIPAMVLNILPLRVSASPGAGLAATLHALAAELRLLRRHGRCRIEQVASDHGLTGGQRFFFSPLINVMPFDMALFEGCETRREVLAAGPGDGFNITIIGSARAEGLTMMLEADPALTSGARFADHVRGLPGFLEECLTGPPDRPLAALVGQPAPVT